ncbi:MAG: hypothetical protein ACE361_09300 [Aureliella sp.]
MVVALQFMACCCLVTAGAAVSDLFVSKQSFPVLRLRRAFACGGASWTRVAVWAACGCVFLVYAKDEPLFYALAVLALIVSALNAFPRITLHEHGIFDGLHFFNLHSLQLHSISDASGVQQAKRLTLKGTRILGASFWIASDQAETLDRFLDGAIRNRELQPVDRWRKLLFSYGFRLGLALLLWAGWQWLAS